LKLHQEAQDRSPKVFEHFQEKPKGFYLPNLKRLINFELRILLLQRQFLLLRRLQFLWLPQSQLLNYLKHLNHLETLQRPQYLNQFQSQLPRQLHL
jgi:hypothetical protein